MKIKKPRERVEKLIVLTVAVLAVSLTVDTFAIQFFKNGSISWETFTVLIAPPVEEAIKGGIASLLGLAYLALRVKGKDLKFRPVTWAVLAGVSSGVLFALAESLTQGESMIALGAGLYTHPIWATGVGLGCWSLLLYGNKTFLAGVYPIAAAGHISWNYYIQNPSGLAKSMSFILIMVIIAIVVWRYLSLQSDPNLLSV